MVHFFNAGLKKSLATSSNSMISCGEFYKSRIIFSIGYIFRLSSEPQWKCGFKKEKIHESKKHQLFKNLQLYLSSEGTKRLSQSEGADQRWRAFEDP